MTHKYQNTGFTPGVSVFTDVDTQLPSIATFNASRVKAQVSGGSVSFVKGKLSLRSSKMADVCGLDCPREVVESFTVEFNVQDGAQGLAAMRAEVLRLFDEAISQYGFDRGLVPPVYASFIEE